ncbi:2-keto-3-deoxygalactonate kinase [Noviherbaspirillum humi]|uniref:2-keto-3-deoxygalactonate kinase n=1 Tax=Noviherbaspirillum humi TaxID=1688639 RepID=A0A239HAR3_9BURK|nr:2-dehydro-3-deoxygalactonokinase [Noviherbaspirillum humi]SNS77913.1 2-keto-3-deoxygalactonate kinase [Noviherbaspirillum humi]
MTSANRPLLGIDWGTSNRRAYLLDAQGGIAAEHADHAGILQVNGDFEASLQQLLQAMKLEQGADIVMSGMVGSRNGWVQVPYLPVTQPLSALAQAMTPVPTALPGVRCRIVPGYTYIDPQGVPDVMRGEEAQIFGAMRMGAPDGWYLLPGTHSKWAELRGGRLLRFLTFMTGELYALLCEHGTLSKVINSREPVPLAFEAGLKASAHGEFTHAAFGCRALVVTDMMPPEHAASYLSGLLIGSEIHDILRRAGSMDAPVQIVGSPSLAARYGRALDILGMTSRAWDPDQVYLAALHAFFKESDQS